MEMKLTRAQSTLDECGVSELRLEFETQLPPRRKEASNTWPPEELHTQETRGEGHEVEGFLGGKRREKRANLQIL